VAAQCSLDSIYQQVFNSPNKSVWATDSDFEGCKPPVGHVLETSYLHSSI